MINIPNKFSVKQRPKGKVFKISKYPCSSSSIFMFKLIILEIGGHMLAEGSHLSVPAPRRVQIFFQVSVTGPYGIVTNATIWYRT